MIKHNWYDVLIAISSNNGLCDVSSELWEETLSTPQCASLCFPLHQSFRYIFFFIICLTFYCFSFSFRGSVCNTLLHPAFSFIIFSQWYMLDVFVDLFSAGQIRIHSTWRNCQIYITKMIQCTVCVFCVREGINIFLSVLCTSLGVCS